MTNDIDNLAASEPGTDAALADLFAAHRERLKRMVRLRLARRLSARVDASDVIQDAFAEATQRFAEYQANPEVSEFVWLRFLTGQKLSQIHRHHLGMQMRDADREVSLHRGSAPEATSAALAAQLVGQLTSPSNAVARAEQSRLVQQALSGMDEIDREVLALRHFEQLSNPEAAQVLGIEEAAAYKRYVRALRRLKEILQSVRDNSGSVA
jgi:RNA polymerase sigma-70 factor (ECF subfamily)